MNQREDRVWHLTLTDGHVVQLLAAMADRYVKRLNDPRVVSASDELRRQLIEQNIDDLLHDDQWFKIYDEGYEEHRRG